MRSFCSVGVSELALLFDAVDDAVDDGVLVDNADESRCFGCANTKRKGDFFRFELHKQ
jgi:hypothetical protein